MEKRVLNEHFADLKQKVSCHILTYLSTISLYLHRSVFMWLKAIGNNVFGTIDGIPTIFTIYIAIYMQFLS